jgi:hypothetical protein
VTDDLGRDGSKHAHKIRFGKGGKGTTAEQNVALALSQFDTVRRAAFKNVGIEFNNVRSQYLYEYAGFAAKPDGFQTPPASKKRKVTQTVEAPIITSIVLSSPIPMSSLSAIEE